MPRALEQSERVYVRRLAATDERALRRLRRESWEFLAPWEPKPEGMSPHGPRWFQKYLMSSRKQDCERLLLFRIEDDALLGCINQNQIVRGVSQSAILGYWIGAAHAQHGYMREGLELALRHAFGRLGLHRLEANIRPANEASIALVRAVGFTQEGFSRRYLKIAGEWCDHQRWAILLEDWRAQRGV